MSLLVLEGVACRRGERLLFEALDLSLEPGGATIVTGPNGAGKSSLLRIAAGLLAPSAGHVRRAGEVAYLGEVAALDPERTLWEALRFWAKLDRAEPALAPAMAAMGVADLAEVPVGFLSTGQRRRAAIARTIARGVPLWILDEPANGLDIDGIARLGRAIDVHRGGGGAVLAATHLPLPIEAASLVLGRAAA